MRLLMLLLLAVPCAAEEIPLSEVLGHGIAGTKSLRKIDPDSHDVPHYSKPTTTSAYWKLAQALKKPPEESLHEAFVVAGTPLEALKSASQLLSENGDPSDKFSPDDELYVVFFCRFSSRYISIDKIEKQGGKIEIAYQQHAHLSADLTSHCALIPLGKLEPGDYQIVLEQLPTEYDNPEGRAWPEKADDARVCKGATFTVSDRSKP